MERKAASILLAPHNSNLVVTGNSIKDISKANPMGMRMDFAKIIIAKTAKIAAMAKNSFLKDNVIFLVRDDYT